MTLTVAFLASEALLVLMQAAVAWVVAASLLIWPWVVAVWVVVGANEIAIALVMALLAAFLALETFLDLVGAIKAWGLADPLVTGAWIACRMSGRFRACKDDLICVVTLSLPVGYWEPWVALAVTLFVLLAFLG